MLSACNVGDGRRRGGGALLGLASSLMSFGASYRRRPADPGVRRRLVPVMVRLHRALHAGVEPARRSPCAAVSDDGLLDPTAAAFVAIGA